MFRSLASVLSAFMFCLGLCGEASATDWQTIESRLKEVVSSPEFVEAALDQYKFQGPSRAAMRTHFVELYRSDEVVKALVTEMRNLGIDNHAELYGDNPVKFGRKLGAELMQSWAIKGIARLPASDHRNFYRYLLRWMTIATPEDCKQVMFAQDKSAMDSGRLEMKYFARMSQAELEAYLALMRKAIFAELRDFPSTRSLNGEQLQIADKAFQAKFEDALKNDKASLDVLMAMTDPENAPPQAACSAGKLILRTMLDMKGHAGEWMMLKMVLSSQL